MNKTFQWEPSRLTRVLIWIAALAVVALMTIRSLLRIDRPGLIGLWDIPGLRFLRHQVMKRLPPPIQGFLRRLK